MNLTKKRALDLIDTVILPISCKVRQDSQLYGHFPDRESFLQHNLRMGQLAIAMLYAPKKAEQLMAAMHQAHARHGLSLEVLTPFVTEFFQRYVAWCRMSKLVPDTQRDRLEDEADVYLQRWKKDYTRVLRASTQRQAEEVVMFDGQGESAEKEFTFFEAEQTDKAIDEMHTSGVDKQVVSAREYMASGEMLPEQISVIIDEFAELEELFAQHLRLDEDFVHDFQSHLKYLADNLFSSIEFEQMGYSLQQLLRIVDQALALNEENKVLIYALLEQLVLDLRSWVNNLFVEQTAVDIHYLDAALLASIAQIEMMLNLE